MRECQKMPDNMQRSKARERKEKHGHSRESMGMQGKARESSRELRSLALLASLAPSSNKTQKLQEKLPKNLFRPPYTFPKKKQGNCREAQQENARKSMGTLGKAWSCKGKPEKALDAPSGNNMQKLPKNI